MARPGYVLTRTLEEIRSLCIEEGECWIWPGARDGSGNPQIRHQGRSISARRLVASLATGRQIEPWLVVSPMCGDRKCISPNCARITTVAHAHKMAAARGAHSSPAKVAKTTAAVRAKSRITEEMVSEIRSSEESSYVISARLGVSRSHVKAIRAYRARVPFANPFSQLIRMAA